MSTLNAFIGGGTPPHRPVHSTLVSNAGIVTTLPELGSWASLPTQVGTIQAQSTQTS